LAEEFQTWVQAVGTDGPIRGIGCIFWLPLLLLSLLLALVPYALLAAALAIASIVLTGFLVRSRRMPGAWLGRSSRWWLGLCGAAIVIAVCLLGLVPGRPLMGLVTRLKMADWCGNVLSATDTLSPSGRHVAIVKHWGCAAGGGLPITEVVIRDDWDRFELYALTLAGALDDREVALDWADDNNLTIVTLAPWTGRRETAWNQVRIHYVESR
jgi:hypothetical protein